MLPMTQLWRHTTSLGGVVYVGVLLVRPSALSVVPTIGVGTKEKFLNNPSQPSISPSGASSAPPKTSSPLPSNSRMTASAARPSLLVSVSQSILTSVPVESSRTSPTVAASSRGSSQYLFDLLAHCNAEFIELDDKLIQREKLITSLELRLDE